MIFLAATAAALRSVASHVAIQSGRTRPTFPSRALARFPAPINAAINSLHSYAP
jgi:hypothetical protein